MSTSSGSKYPNSRLRRTNPPGAAPVTQRSSPSLSTSSSSSSLSSSSSSSSSSHTSSSSSPATSLSSSPPPPAESWRSAPSQAGPHPSKTSGSWRARSPLPPSGAPQPTDKKASWAKKGALGHLPTYSADDHGDSCLAKKIRANGEFKAEGFFGHPVLILSDPDDKGMVKIFPLTTWGGKSIEEKWKDMEDSKKARKFSHFCQIEHPGVEATLPELSLMDGGRIQRRSYVNMQTCWEVEESILNKYRGNKGDSVLFVTPRSFKIVENYANSKQML